MGSQDENEQVVGTDDEEENQDGAPPAKKLKLQIAACSDEELAATWFDPEVSSFQPVFHFQIQLILIIYRYCDVLSIHRSFRLMMMLPNC